MCQFIADTLEDCYETLPLKARPAHTQVYWVEAVSHDNFDYIDQKVHEIFSNCVEANCQSHEFMRLVKIRDLWNKKDDNLVANG